MYKIFRTFDDPLTAGNLGGTSKNHTSKSCRVVGSVC